MAEVMVIEGNGFIVTNAIVKCAANSRRDALMRALEATDKHALETGMIYIITNYEIQQVPGTSIHYTVKMFSEKGE
jgi:hypothetical protein